MRLQNKMYVLGMHDDIESYVCTKLLQNTILHINFWKEYNGGHNSPRKLTKEKCTSYILQLLNQLIVEI